MEIEKISSEESEMIGDLYDAMGQDNWNKAKDLVEIIRDRIGQQPDRNTKRRTDFSGKELQDIFTNQKIKMR